MGARPPKMRFWVQYGPFWGFGAQNRFFGPKMRPWAPLRKTLQKHKGLGRFLEAQGRKTPNLRETWRKFTPEQDFW